MGLQYSSNNFLNDKTITKTVISGSNISIDELSISSFLAVEYYVSIFSSASSCSFTISVLNDNNIIKSNEYSMLGYIDDVEVDVDYDVEKIYLKINNFGSEEVSAKVVRRNLRTKN